MSKLNELRRDVALQRYEVDAHAVAEAMLRKLAPVNWGPIPVITSAPEITGPEAQAMSLPGHSTAA
jgi:hypothetical protein